MNLIEYIQKIIDVVSSLRPVKTKHMTDITFDNQHRYYNIIMLASKLPYQNTRERATTLWTINNLVHQLRGEVIHELQDKEL